MPDKKPAAAKKSTTQWAAQFLVASELVRRNYTVSFTMGNHTPDADLVVRSPKDELFLVDVKGQRQKGAWLVKTKSPIRALFYILVYLAPLPEDNGSRKPDEFFVLTQEEASELEKAYPASHPNDKGIFPGFGWHDPERFQDDWSKLPR